MIPIKDSFVSQKMNGYKKSHTGSRFAEYGNQQTQNSQAESFRKNAFPRQSHSRQKHSSHSQQFNMSKKDQRRKREKQVSDSRQSSRRQKTSNLRESLFSFDSGQMAQPSKRSHSMRAQNFQSKYGKPAHQNEMKKSGSKQQKYNPGMEYMDGSGQPSALVQSNYWGKKVNKVPLIGHRSKSLNNKEKYQNTLAKAANAQGPSSRKVQTRNSFGRKNQLKYSSKMSGGGKEHARNQKMEAMLGLNSSGSLNEKFSKHSVGSQPFSMGNLKVSGFASPKNNLVQNHFTKQNNLVGSHVQVKTNFSKKNMGNSKHQMRGSQVTENKIDYSVQMKFVNVPGMEHGKEKVCQDSVLINKFKFNQEVYYVFAVFDGHGRHGEHVSQFAKKNIISVIKHFLKEEFSQGKVQMKRVLHKSCYYLNKKIEKISQKFTKKWGAQADLLTSQVEGSVDAFDASLSGTTCSLVLLHRNKVYSISLGDSKAVLGILHPGESSFRLMPYVISTEHKTSSTSEQTRIRNMGGLLFPLKDKNGEEVGPIRIWNSSRKYPGLMVSRSFGDLVGKTCGVSGDPDIIDMNLTRSHRCLIVASDGFWDMHSNLEALSNLYSKERGQMVDIQKMLVQITKRTLNRWKQNFGNVHRDDISIILVYFDHQ